MAEFRGIKTCLFLIVMLQFAEAATEQRLTVRDGDEVTLPCVSVTEDQNNCYSTRWFYHPGDRSTVDLVKNGQIDEAEAESHRLNVSQKCSLVVKKVTQEDAGRYYCRQGRPGGQPKDARVLLSVVSMTEETIGDEVTLRCSVGTYRRCRHRVKWTNGGEDVDKDNKDLKTSQSSCSVSLSFKTSHVFHTPSFTSLKCEVTDGDKVMQFPLRNSPSGDETGPSATKTTKPPETETPETKTTTKKKVKMTPETKTTTKKKVKMTPETKTTTSPPGDKEPVDPGDDATKTTTESAVNETPERETTSSPGTDEPVDPGLLRTFVVCLGLAALLISVVTVNIWTRTKGKETRMEEIMQLDEVVEEDDSVNYENTGEPSASVSLD